MGGASAFFGVYTGAGLSCLRTQSWGASEVVCGAICATDENTMTNVNTKSMDFDAI